MSNPDNGPMIEAKGLCKYYGPFAAIDRVSFKIPRGQVVAFLGPNGAGKSTTMKILTGFMAATSGTATIGGYDVYEQRIEAAQLIGYLPENGPLYVEMTPGSLLRYMGAARGLSGGDLSARLDFVAEKCSLKSVWGKAISKLSRGFRQRVGMAQALLHDPEVLILDEPTSGLDPNQVHEVRELIRSLGQKKTIMLSTHILQEVRAVASRAILVNNGKVVFDDSVEKMEGQEHDMDAAFRKLTRHAKVAG
ncbi:MAG: ATP-binding cassette domain-containing protein [Planctomycetes bacterium]|nr:ATP-binding cassette domain-containing protein [Planctomycetota bacterium]